jgi:hypothetical protein
LKQAGNHAQETSRIFPTSRLTAEIHVDETGLWCARVLLVASNVAWGYVTIDQSVTIEHHASELNRRGDQVAALAELMVTYPRDTEASEAHRLLQKTMPHRIAKLTGDSVEVDEFSFVHQSGRLVRVVPF